MIAISQDVNIPLELRYTKMSLAEGETVKIAGFGTFLVRKKGERKGRNFKRYP